MEYWFIVVFAGLILVLLLSLQEKAKGIAQRKTTYKDPNNLPVSVRECIDKNDKLGAIKLYRTEVGAGLKEADEVISQHTD